MANPWIVYVMLVMTGLLFALFIFLLLRVAAFRIDRPRTSRGYFGIPYQRTIKYWNKNNFTPEGLPWLRRLQVCGIVIWIWAFIVLIS